MLLSPPRKLALALALLILPGFNACAPLILPTEPAVLDWSQRRAQLSKMQWWGVRGRIAMQTTKDAWSASLSWRQTGENYDIRLFDLFGGEALSVKGGKNHVLLTTDEGETFTERNAARLIARHTGWEVPVAGLSYWARSLSVPTIPIKQKFDGAGRLSELHQSGWVIMFQDYQAVGDLEMPRKLRLVNQHFTIKLILKDWQLRAAPGA